MFHNFQRLIEVYEELGAGVNDLDIVQETPTDVCAISRSFVTSFRKYVENAIKSLLAGSNEKSKMLPGGDLQCLDLSFIPGNENILYCKATSDKESANGEVDGLDVTVNSKITCKLIVPYVSFGKTLVMLFLPQLTYCSD